MKKGLSDYKYVEMYKKGKSQKEILSYFWFKYQPLVKSIVHKHFHYKQTDMDWEDCIQNCFLLLPKVLDKINLKKIKNKDIFSFGAIIKYYLKSYTKLDFKKACKYYNKTITAEDCAIQVNDEYSISPIDKYMISKDNVENDFIKREFNYEFRDIFKEFVYSCNEDEQKLLELCVDKNTSSGKVSYNRSGYINEAVFLKKGYSKDNQKTRGKITRQFFYQKVNKLEKRFIDHMRQYGYYSDASLKAVGLTKIIYGKINAKYV